MSGILISPSLFSSVNWFQNCPRSWKDGARKQLDEMLNRSGTWDPSPDVKRGIDFEDTVYRVLRTKSDKRGTEYFNKVLERCRGGVFQKKSKKFIEFEGNEYCIYGKLDVWFPVEIIDIKTTKEGKSVDEYREKYLTTMQHHLYCFTEDIPLFTYIVVLFDSADKITGVIEIEYASNLEAEETYIKKKIGELKTFFNDKPEWYEAWKHIYSLYNN